MININERLKDVSRPSSIFPSRKKKIRLNWNELSPGYPSEVIDRIRDLITPEIISSYPEYDVIYPLTADYFGVDLNQIILEAGSECGIKNVFEVFVTKGSFVVKPAPEFVMVKVYMDIFGARERDVHYDRDLTFSVPELLAAIDKDTSLVYLANPNAPTGQFIEQDEIVRILKKAREAGAVVLLDECYIDFSDKPSCLGLIEVYDNLIISRSFSKAFGLAGVRLGVLITNPFFCEQLHKTRPMREINAFAAEIGKFMLLNKEIPTAMTRQIIEAREWVSAELRKHGYWVQASRTNFILVDFGNDKDKFVNKCNQLDILVKDDLGHPAVDSYVCISIGTRELMEKVLDMLFPL